jgi:hypothetical protein
MKWAQGQGQRWPYPFLSNLPYACFRNGNQPDESWTIKDQPNHAKEEGKRFRLRMILYTSKERRPPLLLAESI